MLQFHRYEVRDRDDKWCERRKVYRCVLCSRLEVGRCGARRERNCMPCAERHRKDVARVGRSGTRDRPEGFFFNTLTAPGKEGGIFFDRKYCKHAPDVTCSGDIGCKAGRFAAAVWNGGAPRAWNDFMTDLRRELGVDVQFFGSWETQLRGLLHRHSLLYAPGVSEARMRLAVKKLAARHGFGRIFDVQAISGADARQIARTSGYIAAYVSKGSERALCLNRKTGEMQPDGRGYRAWSASRRWGQTIASVRRERATFVSGLTQERHPQAPLGAEDGAAGALDLDSQIYALIGAISSAFPADVSSQLS